jgi:hypothetical protein
MNTSERTRLNELMGRLADGDNTAVFDLHAEFGSWLAAKMRLHLRALNARGPSRDDLEGLVLDAWMTLRDCAGAWDPDGGALPWNWAHHRLRQVASAWVGQYADELDDNLTAPAVSHVVDLSDDDRGVLVVLNDLAEGHELVALLRDALHLIVSERDRVVLLEVGIQEVLGDPSPSATVASLLDMSPEAVRKARSRARSRLRTLAAQDERFAQLPTLDPAA